MTWRFPPEMLCPHERAEPGRLETIGEHAGVKHRIADELLPEKPRILELGVRAGYSAFAMLSARPDAQYIGVDAENGSHGGQDGPWTWWAEKILAPFDARIELADTQRCRVTDGRLDSPSGPVAEGPFDLIHVDADHTTEGCLHDLALAADLLGEGGVILVDDYDYIPEVRVAVDKFVAGGQLDRDYRPSPRGEMLLRPAPARAMSGLPRR